MVGAVVGRDNAAIRAGMHSTLATAGNYDAFLRRVQLDDMPIQTAMVLLRMCLAPAMNYYLRCIVPACIADEAAQFDRRVVEAAMAKLDLDESQRTEQSTTLLQRKLRDGGFALVPAVRTSPAAFLGSLAACHTEPVLAKYCGAVPVPNASLLHGWIVDSLHRIRRMAPGDNYQQNIRPLLPASAGTFFNFYAAGDASAASTLQRALNAKANEHTVRAAVKHMKEQV